MKPMLKIAVGAMLAASLLISACSQNGAVQESGNRADTEQTGSEQQVTLKLWNRIQRDMFDEAIAGFEQEHPNIKIEMTALPEAGQEVAQFQAAIAGDELPDLFVKPTAYNLPQLVGLGKLHELDSVFPADSYDQYTAGTFAEGVSMIDNKVYQFPLFSSLHGSLMMYYNKNVLSDLGISESDIPATWDELIEIGKQIYDKSGGKTYALVVGAKTNYMATDMVNQLSTPISPESGLDYRTGQYNWNTEGIKETITLFERLYNEKVLAPATLDADTGKAYAVLKNGEAAFMIQGNWGGVTLNKPDENDVKQFSSEDWGVVPLPTRDGNDSFRYFEGGSGESIMVSKTTEHWPEVELFLNYLKDHIYEDVAEKGYSLPSKKIDNLQDVSATPHDQAIASIMEKSKILTPSVYKQNPNATEVMDKFNGYVPRDNVGSIFHAYLTGQIKDLDQSLQQLTDDFNQALDKALQESGGKVTREDFVFEDWTPGQPYNN